MRLDVRREPGYYNDLSTRVREIVLLASILVGVTAFGAVFAVANTMYAAVEGRKREIAKLRTIGSKRFAIVLAAMACGLLISAACRKLEGPPKTDQAPPTRTPTAQTPAPPPEPQPAQLEISTSVDDSEQWLFAEKPVDRAEGGWVTGSFDPQRNKLTVHTKDVERFAINTGRIPIDWRRLVVLSIDGKNSELRKRDFDLYHFALSDHGEWVVMAPQP